MTSNSINASLAKNIWQGGVCLFPVILIWLAYAPLIIGDVRRTPESSL